MTKLHIDAAFDKTIDSPTLLNFENGYINENFSSHDCKMYDDGGKRLILSEINNLLYTGHDEEEAGSTFLLVRSKSTSKVRLIQVNTAQLAPYMDVDKKPESAVHDNSLLELSRKFGSKKGKQKIEQQEKLKSNIEVVKTQMENIQKTVTEDKLDLTSYTTKDSDEFYLPPINRQASKVENVYELSELLSDEQFDRIWKEIEGKDYETEYHEVIKPIVAGKDLTEKHTVLALYASALYYLYGSNSRDIGKKFFSVSSSPTLNEIILNNFTQTVNNKRLRPNMYKDKTLCHAIVMTLILSDYKFDLEILSANIKLAANTASTKCRAVCATVGNVGNKKLVQLKLPLPNNANIRRRSAKF